MLEGFSFDVSHQELERILSDVEVWFETANRDTGLEWLPVQSICSFLCNELGYEDQDEFEDALQGSFEDFLKSFPHIQVKDAEDGQPAMFRVEELPPKDPVRLTFEVKTRSELLDTTFMKSKEARVMVDEEGLGFEICADQRRAIDSIWNHLANAKRELERHSEMMIKQTGSSEGEQLEGILKTAQGLGELLDVDRAFKIVVEDPSGLSEFKPADKVLVEKLEGVEKLEALKIISAPATIKEEDEYEEKGS